MSYYSEEKKTSPIIENSTFSYHVLPTTSFSWKNDMITTRTTTSRDEKRDEDTTRSTLSSSDDDAYKTTEIMYRTVKTKNLINNEESKEHVITSGTIISNDDNNNNVLFETFEDLSFTPTMAMKIDSSETIDNSNDGEETKNSSSLTKHLSTSQNIINDDGNATTITSLSSIRHNPSVFMLVGKNLMSSDNNIPNSSSDAASGSRKDDDFSKDDVVDDVTHFTNINPDTITCPLCLQDKPIHRQHGGDTTKRIFWKKHVFTIVTMTSIATISFLFGVAYSRRNQEKMMERIANDCQRRQRGDEMKFLMMLGAPLVKIVAEPVLSYASCYFFGVPLAQGTCMTGGDGLVI